MKLIKVHFIFLICLLAFVQNLHAQSGIGTLSIQGNLKKSNGLSVDDGIYSLSFKLYTAPTGGTALWTETQTSVSLVGGVYSVALGTVTPLTPDFAVPYWLGVTVGTSAEIQPRTALTAAPYAMAVLGTAPAYFGDVKTSYQANDHAGWVRLNGRAKTTLAATQQARATALGIGANLPSDEGRALAGISSGQTAGQTSGGGSTINIATNNLPNVTLTTSSAGAHTHGISATQTFSYGSIASQGSPLLMTSAFITGQPLFAGSGTAFTTGAHFHQAILNGGVNQVPITVPPAASFVLNFFIYLGI
jgi:hypothetical protein